MATSGGRTFKSNQVCVRLAQITNRDVSINQILTSIAMLGVAYSHVLNAEGEKMQYLLNGLNPTVGDVLAVNQSIVGVMKAVENNEMFLGNSLKDVLSSIN